METSRIRGLMVIYLDGVIRSLIAFLFIGVGSYIVFVGFFKINMILVLPIVFILSVMISPLLSRIKLGEKVIVGYENWLKKTFKIKE